VSATLSYEKFRSLGYLGDADWANSSRHHQLAPHQNNGVIRVILGPENSASIINMPQLSNLRWEPTRRRSFRRGILARSSKKYCAPALVP